MFEKKRGTRFLASVMAFVMLLSLAPVGALAADEPPTNEECSTMPLPAAEDDNQQDVADEDNNTPTPQPAKDSDSAEATKSEGDFDESFSNADTSDNDNGIAAQNLSLNEPAQEQSITAEYWVTNSKVEVSGQNSKTISVDELEGYGEEGVDIEVFAPMTGTQDANDAIFWQARVLTTANSNDSNVYVQNYQSNVPDINCTNKGEKLTKIRVHNNQIQYQTEQSDSEWNNYVQTEYTDYYYANWDKWFSVPKSGTQIVFYYLIKTDFLKSIQVNVSDWPALVAPTNRPQYRQLRYEVWVKNADGSVAGTTPIDSKDTYYYSGVDISDVQVRMNDLSQYKIDSIEITDPYTDPTVSQNGAGSDFSLNLSRVSAGSTVTIKIYVTPYKYTVKYLLDGEQYGDTTSYEPGQSVTVEANPTKTGYIFSSWSTSDSDVVINDNNTFTMPARNVEFTASWNPSTNTAYTVKHFLQNLDGSYPTEAYETETKSGTTGENTAATAKSYTGFTAQSFAQRTIAANGSTVVEIKYERNKHNITYQITGDYFVNRSYTTVDNVPFGSTLSLINDNMAQDGYTFSEWSGLPETMPDKDVTVTGYYTKDQDPVDPPTDPDTDLVNAMYFVLMPGQGVPNSGVSQGVDKYFPNASNNGGVEDRNNTNGYAGKITKAATELTGANTTDGYFNVQGVGNQYLKDIGNLGYFDARNYTNNVYNGTLPKGLSGFNMQNKKIVWYVIKKEGNNYHVDGYVKGVPITLTYHENFGTSNAEKIINQNINGTVLNSGDKVRIQGYSQVFSDAANQHQGWSFEGWFTKNGQEYKQEETTLIDSVDLYARWTKSYDVVTHFMDANGDQKAERTKSNLSGVHGTLLKDMVLPLNQVNTDGITGNYVYVPSETKYSVGNGDKVPVGTTTFTTANTVIHQYYYLDETGETGKDKENKPTDKPDGIPDAWQHKVTFKVVNGKWNDDSSDNIVVYVNAKDKDGETLESKLTEAQIPAVGEKPNSGYRASGSWDKSLSAGLKITGDTEFTFTYSRRSSGGSSRPSTPPTVDIPDNDVPTGLNDMLPIE